MVVLAGLAVTILPVEALRLEDGVQLYPEAPLTVRIAEPEAQKLVELTDKTGSGTTVTVTVTGEAWHEPLPPVMV